MGPLHRNQGMASGHEGAEVVVQWLEVGTGKLAGGEAAGGGWAVATAVLGGAANAAVGVAAAAWDAICS